MITLDLIYVLLLFLFQMSLAQHQPAPLPSVAPLRSGTAVPLSRGGGPPPGPARFAGSHSPLLRADPGSPGGARSPGRPDSTWAHPAKPLSPSVSSPRPVTSPLSAPGPAMTSDDPGEVGAAWPSSPGRSQAGYDSPEFPPGPDALGRLGGPQPDRRSLAEGGAEANGGEGMQAEPDGRTGGGPWEAGATRLAAFFRHQTGTAVS